MLLPETFANAAGCSYLLGILDHQAVAAAAFHRAPESITQLRIHVIPPFRRQGIGSQLLQYACAAATGPAGGISEISREPAAEPFCEKNGFRRVELVTTVEAPIQGLREHMTRLRRRLLSDPSRRVEWVPLSAAPAAEVARLHAEHIAHGRELNPLRAMVAGTPGLDSSPVAMIHGKVAGILLWEIQGSTAVVSSRVVAPGHHGTWVNAILLAAGLDEVWSRGARRARFSYLDTNRDTRKLAERMQAEVVSVSARFERDECR